MQSSISKRFSTTIAGATVALSALAVTSPAHAALERTGPVSNAPAIGGFPTWYQDRTGLALEFCNPSTQSELEGGWCLLAVGDTVVPEIFPTTYADEHFYYAADAALTPATGGKALFRGAVEAAFVTAVQPGDQMVFSRIRVRMTVVPMTGTYRFIHPYGEESIAADAGDPRGIFFTDDVGLTAGNFEEALTSRVGPFLVPSTTPGGAEMAALTAANPTPDTDPAHFGGAFTPTAYPGTGKAYLADPARVGPITGSIATQRGAPLGTFIDSTGAVRNHNIYRIEGPPGSAIGGRNPDGSTIDFLETADFTLTGRAFADAIPGRVSVDRASYAATATARRLDVYASGAQTTQGRLPTFPRPPVVLPQLSYFTAPCSADAAGNLLAPIGAIEVQMVSSGTSFFGETRPATIPAGVCVKDSAARNALGNIVPAFFNGTVVDEINVTQALFNPAAKTLTVSAISSDSLVPPTLTIDGFNVALAGGQAVVSNLAGAPAKIRVASSAKGSTEANVTTGVVAAAPPPVTLTAVNDSFSVLEDSGAQNLNVLANDLAAAGGTITLVSSPRLGTAVISGGSITYTPNSNANGADALTYKVQVGTQISNVANVAITIVPVNDAPTAVDDGPISVNTGVATALTTLLANDLDPDGAIDLAQAQLVTQPTAVSGIPGGATASTGVDGVITFSATREDTYTFTYRAVDRAGTPSANVATVTINAIFADTVVPSSALFRTDKTRWVVTGTDSSPNQLISIYYANGIAPDGVTNASITPVLIGTAQADALGNWTMDFLPATGILDPRTWKQTPTLVRAVSPLGGSGSVGLTIRR